MIKHHFSSVYAQIGGLMNTDPMCRAHELRRPAPHGPLYAESSTVEHHHRRFHIDIQRFSVDSLSQSNNGKDFFHPFTIGQVSLRLRACENRGHRRWAQIIFRMIV